jgi:predicted phage tail protein
VAKKYWKDDLGFPVTGEVIRIIPVIMGSKSWSIQTILAVLVVVGVIGMTVGAWGGATWGPYAFRLVLTYGWWRDSDALTTASGIIQ